MDVRGNARFYWTLAAAVLAVLLPLSSASALQVNASPAGRLYVVAGDHVEALDAFTLSPLPAGHSGIARVLAGGTGSAQFVQSPDGTELATVRRNGGTGSHSTLTIVDVHGRAALKRYAVGDLTLLGVSNDGLGWYGIYTAQGGRIVQFVSVRKGVRHTLELRVPHQCCVALQYDALRDRLYALTLHTAWGRNPDPPVVTAWQVSSRRRLATLAIRGTVAGTWSASHTSQLQRVIPGFALSPDGKTLAILDYVDHRLDTVDALRLRWTRNPLIGGPVGTFTTTGPSPFPDPKLSNAEGYDVTSQFSLDGKVVYQEGTATVDYKTPFLFSEALLVESIDVARSEVRGVMHSPPVAPLRVGIDGASVYTAMVKAQGTHAVVVVQRRKSTDLSVVAQQSVARLGGRYVLLDLSG